MAFSITLDPRDAKAMRQFLTATPKELTRAQVLALNRAVKEGATAVSRQLQVNLKAKTKKQDLRSGKAATPKRLERSLNARDRFRSLQYYGGFSETRGRVRNSARGSQIIIRRAVAEGLKVKPWKDKAAVRYPHGFVLRKGGRLRGVAAHRAYRGTERSYKMDYEASKDFQKRLAPKELVGRNPLVILGGPTVGEEFAERIREFEENLLSIYDKKLTQSINYVLTKRKR